MIENEVAALMALRVYDQNIDFDDNLPFDPVGWEKLTNPLPATNGFAYGVFRNTITNEVVIAYRGTDGNNGTTGSGLAFCPQPGNLQRWPDHCALNSLAPSIT